MKKLAALFIAFAVMFSSVGTTILVLDEPTAEAKSYKSGKKSFSSNQNSNFQNNNTSTIKKNDATTNKSTNNTNTAKKDNSKGGFFSGGLMKGLMIGGLAGLLFGSLFGDLGMLGNILGFAINAFAIAIIVILCIKLVQMFTRKKDKEDKRQWNN